MQFKTFDWLSHYGIWANNSSQEPWELMVGFCLISKYSQRTCQLEFKKELKHFSLRNNGSLGKSLSTGVEWKEVIELLENAMKMQSMARKYFKVKTWRLYFDNLSVRVSESKAMQVKTIYTFTNYLYIVTSSFLSQNG